MDRNFKNCRGLLQKIIPDFSKNSRALEEKTDKLACFPFCTFWSKVFFILNNETLSRK